MGEMIRNVEGDEGIENTKILFLWGKVQQGRSGRATWGLVMQVVLRMVQ